MTCARSAPGKDVVNPRLHITLHEIVANQLWGDEPPEMWHTAKHLVVVGYERHEILRPCQRGGSPCATSGRSNATGIGPNDEPRSAIATLDAR